MPLSTAGPPSLWTLCTAWTWRCRPLAASWTRCPASPGVSPSKAGQWWHHKRYHHLKLDTVRWWMASEYEAGFLGITRCINVSPSGAKGWIHWGHHKLVGWSDGIIRISASKKMDPGFNIELDIVSSVINTYLINWYLKLNVVSKHFNQYLYLVYAWYCDI